MFTRKQRAVLFLKERGITIGKLVLTMLVTIVILALWVVPNTIYKLCFVIANKREKGNEGPRFLKAKMSWLFDRVRRLKFVDKMICDGAFKMFGGITEPRPNPFTMDHSYTAWTGLSDESISARHLPEPSAGSGLTTPNHPPVADVLKLFLRLSPSGSMIPAPNMSFLFSSFAQWFTDSVLRTSDGLKYDTNDNVIVDKNGIPVRSDFRVRTNVSNHEIDLCQIYGVDETKTAILRGAQHPIGHQDLGCLDYQMINGEEYPKFYLDQSLAANLTINTKLPVETEFIDLHHEPKLRHLARTAATNQGGYQSLFAVGLEHGNSTVGNSLMNTIFLRSHNEIARKIANSNPAWDDERVFQTSRNVNIVLVLNILMSDYISQLAPLNPELTFYPGLGEKYPWYRKNRIAIEFSLLYRWHPLVPDTFSFFNTPQECMHNNQWLINNGVKEVLKKFSQETAGKIIIGNTPHFLAHIEEQSILLSRDANLASYNDYRVKFGMEPIDSYDELTDSKELVTELKELYGDDPNKLEWYVGIFAEQHLKGEVLGELMGWMVAYDAFTQLLTNPLLSKNIYNEKTFSATGFELVKSIKTFDQLLTELLYPGQKVNCSFNILP